MKNQKWSASAPSNIAWIKYMGKTDHAQNLPTNISLSYTVSQLRTFVEVQVSDGATDTWEPLRRVGLRPIELSEKASFRYLNHLQFLKKYWGIEGSFHVRSANNFPSSCGIASSASSFAALTLCTAQAAKDLMNGDIDDRSEILAELSRQGSGSSCRSFFEPWSVWDKHGAAAADLPWPDLLHQVVICGAGEKEVSTSLAHKRVASSKLFSGRAQRAEERYLELISCLKNGDWKNAFEVTWAEFWDMHALFETSVPSFGYMNAGSLDVLNKIKRTWVEDADGPIVTMDAGPNVHLFYRPEQRDLAANLSREFQKNFRVLDGLSGGEPDNAV